MNEEFEHLSERNLFSCEADAQSVRVYQERLSDVLKSLPNPLAPSGSFPMLRVVTSFPTEPPLPLHVAEANTSGPVAVLKLVNFLRVTEAFKSEELIEGLISSMHGRRLSYADDSFSSIEHTSKSRSAKRKDSTEEPLAGPSGKDSINVSNTSERPIRPIPRHMSPLSCPVPESFPSSTPARDVADEVASAHPPPIPKRLNTGKKGSTKSRIGKPEAASSMTLRRSPRDNKETGGSKQPSLTPPATVSLRRSPREHKSKMAGKK
ncbi:hypothetical protein H0H87_005124 [Tephrocybe sp. NHM501043]|nr:hypothetical protein H0H87_005124 [Tephrocybe sp. NHM501043]